MKKRKLATQQIARSMIYPITQLASTLPSPLLQKQISIHIFLKWQLCNTGIILINYTIRRKYFLDFAQWTFNSFTPEKRSKDYQPMAKRTLNNVYNDAKVSRTLSVNVTTLWCRDTVQGRGWDTNIYYTSYKGRKYFTMPRTDFNVTVLKLNKLWFMRVYCNYKHAGT